MDGISEALLQFDAATRGFLLKIKRDCFNGRSIGKYQEDPRWAALLRVSSRSAQEIVGLECRLWDLERAIAKSYESGHVRERSHIVSLTEDSRFLRGIALGRLGLVEKIRSRAPSIKGAEVLGKPQKWETSLLRFVTRTAAKLSANSTLTAYALGSIKNSTSPQGLHFNRSTHREISLVRVDRPEIEQFLTLLMRRPAVRVKGLLAWNDSLEEIESGRYRFLRGRYWDLEPGGGAFQYVRPVRVTTRLPGEILEATRGALRQGPLPYLELLSRVEAHADNIVGDFGPSVRDSLDHFVDIGLLLLMPPWPTQEDRLEQRIRQLLQGLSDDPSLHRVASGLDELLRLEKELATSLRPERTIVDLKDAFSGLIQAVLPLNNIASPLEIRPHLYEDVLFEPSKPELDSEVFQLSSSTVARLFESVDLASRFAGLFNHRHDVLHTLAAWWKQHEPSRREMPFFEVARGFSALWKQYLPFVNRASESATYTFDPLSTDSLARLLERRQQLLRESAALVEKSPEMETVRVSDLAKLLDAIPRQYVSMLGASVFVQPVDATASSWVLNQIHEGTGRYLSRLTPVLEGNRRQRFVDHLIARSTVTVDGEEADLLEVTDPNAYLTNAHPIQAAKVLHFRGLHLGLARDRCVDLGDLRVRADLDAESFRVLDASGRRVLPVHLSSRRDAALSSILRFLLIFGPGETRGVFPFPYSEKKGDLRIFNRLTCGNLVLHRRRWDVPLASLRKEIEGATDLVAYEHTHTWRRRLGLPAIGFYYERTYSGGVKPQLVDFSSPSLCRLFVLSIRKEKAEQMRFEEALPLPEDFPFDNSAQRRAVEFLIDGLAIRASSRNNSAGH